MYNVRIFAALALAAILMPSAALAAPKTHATPCKYQDRSGVHTGVYTPSGGDGAVCLDTKGKAHELYLKTTKGKLKIRLLDGRTVSVNR